MSKLTDYVTETKGELNRVSWPSRKQTAAYTAIVILVSIFVAAFLGLFDFLFTSGLSKFVNR